MRFKTCAIGILFLLIMGTLKGYPQSSGVTGSKKVQIVDEYHYSESFADTRSYRVFLPPGFEKEGSKKYPVIYFFHGWAQRYFGSMGKGYSDYDKGDENEGDNFQEFVSKNDVIIVKIDGKNQFPSEPYNTSTYNISAVTTFRQFPYYFKELVEHIDSSYPTIPDREHRAVSGLSMGGFMTFWLAAKYPDIVSAAGNFCGSTEFMAGPLEFPARYEHAEMFDSFKGTSVRMHNGTRDRLRFYHQDLNRYWLNVIPQYEFKVYEASHVTCGLGDMFNFLMEAFESPLPLPERWDYIDIYPFFEIRDYEIETTRTRAGFTIMENVDRNGYKIAVRNFLPDGELMTNVEVKVTTAPIYEKNKEYRIIDVDLRTLERKSYTAKSDSKGRLNIQTTGSLHQVGISDELDSPNLTIAQFSMDNQAWAETGKNISLSIDILNKGTLEARGVTAELKGISEGLEILGSKGGLKSLPVLAIDKLDGKFEIRNNKEGVEIAKFKLILRAGDGNEWEEEFELRFKDPVAEITDFIIADGKQMTVVEGAVDSFTGIVGAGNGDGIPNPGETIVVLVKEDGKYIRTNAISYHPGINKDGTHIRIADSWQDYDHIGGAVKYTKPVISSEKTRGESIWFYIEYWLPANHIISGQHIIKKGKVKIQIKGEDKTPPQIQWLQVLTDDRIEARVYDGLPVDKVLLTFAANTEKATMQYIKWEKVPEEFSVELLDNGLDGDAIKGDGIYSRKIKNRPSYFYDLTLEMVDAKGNHGIIDWPKTVFLRSTN